MAWQPNMQPYGNPNMSMGMNYNPTPYMPSNPYSNATTTPQFNNTTNPIPAPQIQPNVAIQGRLVTSKEEALGIPVDFSGQPMLLADLGHGNIFVKKFNMNTGAADFDVYVKMNPQQSTQPITEKTETTTYNFATMQDFQSLNDMVTDMQSTIDSLQKEIDKFKKPVNLSGKGSVKNESSSK